MINYFLCLISECLIGGSAFISLFQAGTIGIFYHYSKNSTPQELNLNLHEGHRRSHDPCKHLKWKALH